MAASLTPSRSNATPGPVFQPLRVDEPPPARALAYLLFLVALAGAMILVARLHLGAPEFLAAIALGIFGNGCMAVYLKQTETTDPAAYAVIPDEHLVSPEADAWGAAQAAALGALGLVPRRRFRYTNPGAPSTGFGQRFDAGRTGDVATIIYTSMRTDAGVRTARIVVFATRFADGGYLFTTNSTYPSLTPPTPGWSSHRFPGLSDIALLAKLHRRLVERAATRRPDPLALGENPLALELELGAASRASRLAHGLVVADEPAKVLRLTLKGAVRAAWLLGPPMFQIREWWNGRRSRAVIRELELAA